MFDDREHGASRSGAFIADYFTLTNAGQVAYLGAEGPRLAVYVVDVGGAPRAMVGPVPKGYEAHSPIESRLDDEQARSHEPARWWKLASPAREEPRRYASCVATFVECRFPRARGAASGAGGTGRALREGRRRLMACCAP